MMSLQRHFLPLNNNMFVRDHLLTHFEDAIKGQDAIALYNMGGGKSCMSHTYCSNIPGIQKKN